MLLVHKHGYQKTQKIRPPRPPPYLGLSPKDTNFCFTPSLMNSASFCLHWRKSRRTLDNNFPTEVFVRGNMMEQRQLALFSWFGFCRWRGIIEDIGSRQHISGPWYKALSSWSLWCLHWWRYIAESISVSNKSGAQWFGQDWIMGKKDRQSPSPCFFLMWYWLNAILRKQ